MAGHAGPTPERWSEFTRDQQVLMIANEMNRASKWMGSEDAARRQSAYERALSLVDLTIGANASPGFRREMLRWRDLLAGLYLSAAAAPDRHAAAVRALLRFTPEASRQIPHVLGAGRAPSTAG